MRLKIYYVDAFTNQVFRGNPAAVVPLKDWLDDSLMQSIAAENNFSETAFFVAKHGKYHIRWFSPVHEVPLCGHATLASAFVIFSLEQTDMSTLSFESMSGELDVSRGPKGLTMNFPRIDPQICAAPESLINGLGKRPAEVLITESDPNYYAVYDTEQDVSDISPNLGLLENLHPYGVVVTAPGSSSDFVSRYFVPSFGIPEDPATGSIHCALAPYWANRLQKRSLYARQISKRGGEIYCENLENRVLISGYAVQYMAGEIFV